MLKPAVLYRDQIVKGMQEYFYTDDMMYETGTLENWTPEIPDCPSEGHIQYAIISNDKLIGYLAYRIDYYSSRVYNFGLFSFDRGNPALGKDVNDELVRLINTYHRVEWRAVGGNPACRGYDNFIKRHNGNKHILREAIKDRAGNYHDDIIYEVINTKN